MSDSEGVDRDATSQRSTVDPNSTATDRDLAERLAAVERAITDEGPVADLSTAAERDRRVEDVTKRVEEIEARLDELEAATQALRGYVGSVRAVNEEVEQRADLALAIAERTERNAVTGDADVDDRHTATPSQATVGADDGDVAAAVGENSRDVAATAATDAAAAANADDAAAADAAADAAGAGVDVGTDADHPAVAAAVPDGNDGGTPVDGLLARLRDVL